MVKEHGGHWVGIGGIVDRDLRFGTESRNLRVGSTVVVWTGFLLGNFLFETRTRIDLETSFSYNCCESLNVVMG